jgi:hypothetical protein
VDHFVLFESFTTAEAAAAAAAAATPVLTLLQLGALVISRNLDRDNFYLHISEKLNERILNHCVSHRHRERERGIEGERERERERERKREKERERSPPL